MRFPSPFTRPWAIAQDGFDLVRGVYSRGAEFQDVVRRALAERGDEPLTNERKVETVDGVAIVPVNGPLFRHAGMLSRISAASSYDDVRADISAAMERADVRAVLLRVSSPGGDADGVAQCAAFVHAQRGRKPIEAVIEGQGSSAAYWISSACDRITAESTALVGSIGVISELQDDSAADEKSGRRTIQIVARQSPLKRTHPVDEALVERRTSQASELASIFIDAVATYRGISPDKVEADFGKGDQLVGESARRAGLVDEIGTIEDVIARLSGAYAPGPAPTPAAAPRPGASNEGAAMATRMKAEEPEKKDEPIAAEKCAKCEGTGKIDGEECDACGGSGKAEAEEPPAAEHEEPDGDEATARVALAKMAGMSASAPLSKIAAALAVKTVPHAEAADLRRRLAVLESERAEEKAKAADAKCAALADRAESLGYTAGMTPVQAKAKREKLIALAKVDFAMAEDHVNDLPAARVTNRRTANGAPVGKPPVPPVDLSGDEGEREVDMGGGVKVMERGAALSAAATQYAAEHKVGFAEALVAVAKERPQLFAKRAE